MSPLVPVPFHSVQLLDGFWQSRVRVNCQVTIPHALDRCEKEGRVGNFERAARVLQGHALEDKSAPGYPFDDTDVYKTLEGAAYSLAVEPNPELDALLDRLIATIASAQEADGYLYTTRTLAPDAPHAWAGHQRWERETDLSHELYNLGHLFEAAVAHYQATRKRTLLEIALSAADLLVRTFGPDKATIWPGHQITEMGLVSLYGVTGEQRYLELARFLLDSRGPDGSPGSGETNNQSHAPAAKQTQAVGHAVRAVYMYSGMADVSAHTETREYAAALDRIWSDIVTHKLYVTGAIGARASGECFGDPDELPNLTAYGETCASIGLVYFSHRMFLSSGNADYIDVLERVLYNGLLSGVSLDGRHFFYPNPLESFGEYERSPWFGCACCPGNIARFLASVTGYFYATSNSTIFVNLYAAGNASITVSDELTVSLNTQTDYPWSGTVRIVIRPSRMVEWALKLRIPGWARGEAVSSDLYYFLDTDGSVPSITINGKPEPVELHEGYATLSRRWQSGDTVELELPMPIRRLKSADRVLGNQGRVALQRGPIVYALEGADHDQGHALDLLLPADSPLLAEFQPELLGGVVVIKGPAHRAEPMGSNLEPRQPASLTAIPYFTWANRGPSEMLVWIPEDAQHAWLRPKPTLASTSRVSLSAGECARAANDQAHPSSSRDESHKRTRLQPGPDGRAWIQFDLATPARVSRVSVYWFESTDFRNETSPQRWRLLFHDGQTWRECEALGPYATVLHVFNEVPLNPVTASAFRLDCEQRSGFAIGLLEWQLG